MAFQYYGLPQEPPPAVVQPPPPPQQQQSPMDMMGGMAGMMDMFGGGAAGAGAGESGAAAAGGGGVTAATSGSTAAGTGTAVGGGTTAASSGGGGGSMGGMGGWAILAAIIGAKAEHTRKTSGVSYEDQFKNVSLAPQKDFDHWELDKYAPLAGGDVYKSSFDAATLDFSNWWKGSTEAPIRAIKDLF